MLNINRTMIAVRLLLSVAMLVCALRAVPADAGVASLADDVVRGAVRHFADDVAEFGGQAAFREAVELSVSRYGDDAAAFLLETGPQGVRLLESHGADMLRWHRAAGDEAVRQAMRPGYASDVLPMVRRYGDDVFYVEAKAPGLSGKLFETFGDRVPGLVQRLSPANAERLGIFAKSLKTAGKADRFASVVERFGDAVFTTIDKALILVGRNTKGAGMTMGFGAVLVHPEIMSEFMHALGEMPGEVVKALIAAFTDIIIGAAAQDGASGGGTGFPLRTLIPGGVLIALPCALFGPRLWRRPKA